MDYLKLRLRSFAIPEPFYTLQCGSSHELPLKYGLHEYSDVDILFYCYDICAIPRNRNHPKNTKCTILRIDSTETPSGYARLTIEGDSTKNKPPYYRRPPMLANIESGGPTIKCVSKHAKPIRGQHRLTHIQVDIDKVFAIYCPYWPPEAEEWRKRNRFHGWPNEELIARITRGGCHFVSKLRTWSTCDDTEWRFSFSKAELLLIHSWTPDQKLVYHIIRLIKKRLPKEFGGDRNKEFPTYYFKTLMFWACEEFHPEFWREENMMTCVHTLFLRFKKCLNEKFCPNYFIPDCNIMSHLKDEDGCQTELDALLKFVAKGELLYVVHITGGLVLSGSFEHYCIQTTQTSFPINEILNRRFPQYLSESEWFLPGMKYLHSAIEAHLRLMSFDNVTSRKESKDYVECLENFKCALIGNEDFESYRYANAELSFYEVVNAILFRKQTRNSIIIYRRELRKGFGDDAFDTQVKESDPSTLLPTVLSYRANFYFTAMQSYKESLTECDRCVEIIDIVYDGARFLNSYIPVLVCNSLSQLYDEHLQVILGFVTLHRNISSSDSSKASTAHEVCLKLDAKVFLKYLRVQCGHKLSVKPVRVVCLPCLVNFDFEVPCISRLVRHDLFSATVLFAALRQSGVYDEQVPLTLIHRHCSLAIQTFRRFSSKIEWKRLC